MSETPDFLEIARAVFMRDEPIPAIADALRLVWNARAAADLTTLETALSSTMGVIAAGPYVKNLGGARRRVD